MLASARLLLYSMLTVYSAIGDNRPNIVFMLADDMGSNDVGFLGSEIYTPSLNRLVNDSVLLRNHYAQYYCSPSRGALFTGRYPVSQTRYI